MTEIEPKVCRTEFGLPALSVGQRAKHLRPSFQTFPKTAAKVVTKAARTCETPEPTQTPVRSAKSRQKRLSDLNPA